MRREPSGETFGWSVRIEKQLSILAVRELPMSTTVRHPQTLFEGLGGLWTHPTCSRKARGWWRQPRAELGSTKGGNEPLDLHMSFSYWMTFECHGFSW